MKYMAEEEQVKFWENHTKARRARDRKLAELPFSEKIAITEKLQADAEILQNAKKVEPFGLGKLPLSTCNTLTKDYSSTGVNWWLGIATIPIKEGK